MSTITSPPAMQSKTRIIFDLADELSPDEIAQFEAAAVESGEPDLTEHFLNNTLRLPQVPEKAA